MAPNERARRVREIRAECYTDYPARLDYNVDIDLSHNSEDWVLQPRDEHRRRALAT
jgi:hypothetical protein